MATKKRNLQKFDEEVDQIEKKMVDQMVDPLIAKRDALMKLNSEIAMPTLDIDGLAFHESYYTTRGNTYDAPTLVAFAKHKNYKFCNFFRKIMFSSM